MKVMLRLQGTTVLIISEEVEITATLVEEEDRSTPFTAPPAGYFEGFADNLMARIKAAENGSQTGIGSHCPLKLNSLEKKIPYSVPEGHFD